MDKRKAFGYRNWFIKNAIYNLLMEDKDYFGIDTIVYDNKIELSEEEISARYKLCNLIKGYLIGETYINNTDIMAVLYKIRFTIVDGRLKSAIEYESMVKDIKEEENEMSYEEMLDNITLV